jgi:hypothetical protein
MFTFCPKTSPRPAKRTLGFLKATPRHFRFCVRWNRVPHQGIILNQHTARMAWSIKVDCPVSSGMGEVAS